MKESKNFLKLGRTVVVHVQTSKREKLATMEFLKFHRGLIGWSRVCYPLRRSNLARRLCSPGLRTVYPSVGLSTSCRLFRARFCALGRRDAFGTCRRRLVLR
jgi:hypothetical protein